MSESPFIFKNLEQERRHAKHYAEVFEDPQVADKYMEQIVTKKPLEFRLQQIEPIKVPTDPKCYFQYLNFKLDRNDKGIWHCVIEYREPELEPWDPPRCHYSTRGEHQDRQEAFLNAFVKLNESYCPEMTEEELRPIGISFLYRVYREIVPIQLPEGLVDLDLNMFRSIHPDFVQGKPILAVEIRLTEKEIEYYKKRISQHQAILIRSQQDLEKLVKKRDLLLAEKLSKMAPVVSTE